MCRNIATDTHWGEHGVCRNLLGARAAIVAIVLALITKETYTSLFVGIVVGALLLAGFDPINAVNYIIVGEIGEGEDAMAVGFLNAISDHGMRAFSSSS